jgi:hypothetical protein
MLVTLLLASLQLGGAVPAQDVIVYGKDDSVTFASPASAAPPQDPVMAAFLRSFKADLEKPAAFEKPMPVREFPVWGRSVHGAQGPL